MVPEEPNQIQNSLLRHFPNKLEFRIGAFSTSEDLKKARIRNALAVILLTSRVDMVCTSVNLLDLLAPHTYTRLMRACVRACVRACHTTMLGCKEWISRRHAQHFAVDFDSATCT
jgi:hypothetical protein